MEVQHFNRMVYYVMDIILWQISSVFVVSKRMRVCTCTESGTSKHTATQQHIK